MLPSQVDYDVLNSFLSLDISSKNIIVAFDFFVSCLVETKLLAFELHKNKHISHLCSFLIGVAATTILGERASLPASKQSAIKVN